MKGKENRMLTFLHCADVHLDTPYPTLDRERSEERCAALRGCVSAMFAYIRKNNIPLAFIAGDLFSGNVRRETLRRLVKEMAATPGCRFFIAPGKSDAYGPTSPYVTTEFPGNVHIFKTPEVTCVSLDDLSVDVYGFACMQGEKGTPRPLEGFSLRDRSRISFFVGHLSGDGGEPGMPVATYAALAGAGFTYAALGSRHNSDGMHRLGGTYSGYAGCFEGRGFDEPGLKGAVFGALTTEAGRIPTLSVRRLRFSRKRYEAETVDVGGCDCLTSVAERVGERIREKQYDRDTSLSLTLTGEVPVSLYVDREALLPLLPPIEQLVLTDETDAEASLAALLSDPTLRGAYARELSAIATEDKETVRLALRLGLAALEESGK